VKRAKRKKKITKTQRAVAEAERLARLLADAPATSPGALAPPALIADPRLAPAAKFWKDHAEQLCAIGTLKALDRFTFAMFCVYVGEFIAAEDDILTQGYSVKVKTISGDHMPRENPSVDRRDFAAKMILEMSRMFGLSQVDRFNISKLARGAGLQGELFDPLGDAPATPDTQDQDKATADWNALTGRQLN
jgi:P27 family predicted phage terminase small subunit